MKLTLSLLFALLTLPTMAQKKRFTLDDLIPGGSTYYAHSYPETKYLTWWGDACIEQGMDKCELVSKNHGTTRTGLVLNSLTLENINKILSAHGRKTIDHLYNATFPFPEKPYVMID